MGYAKIAGDLPPVVADGATRSFEVGEYGSPLLAGRVEGLAPLDDARMEGARAAAASTTVLGWKYIAGPEGVVDADYPTAISLSFEWTGGWSGDGAISFGA